VCGGQQESSGAAAAAAAAAATVTSSCQQFSWLCGLSLVPHTPTILQRQRPGFDYFPTESFEHIFYGYYQQQKLDLKNAISIERQS
jgi:hypothetical protein